MTVVNRDPAPGPLAAFPGVGRIRIADRVDEAFDAAIIMECGSLDRTGVAGLDGSTVINVDHHPGNTGYGAGATGSTHRPRPAPRWCTT